MNTIFSNIKKEKGSTLIAVIFFVSTLTLAGLVMVQFVQNNSNLIAVDAQAANAFYSAQSAIDYAVKKSLNTNNWHWSANNQTIASGTASINVEDSTIYNYLKDTLQVRVLITSGNASSRQIFRMRLTDISGYAVYISGNLNDVTINDSAGNPNPSLAYDHATELPEIDTYKLKQMAIAQGHYFSGSLSLSNGASYPTGTDANFYHPRPNGVPSDTPNVVYIEGNLEVKNSAQIFGIIVVNGDVDLKNSQKLEGILYLPSPVSVVQQDVDMHNKESIYGGIFGGANVEGLGNESKINVYYRASYVKKFFSSYAIHGLPYITIWRNWKQF
jgi:Tfp pilus assembly protein PilX